jgi:uncharacterized protein (DUF433 family)
MTTHLTDRITVDPERCAGRPTVRGTRLQVDTVLGHLAAGDTVEDILAAFPTLEPADIPACLEFAQQLIYQQFERRAA